MRKHLCLAIAVTCLALAGCLPGGAVRGKTNPEPPPATATGTKTPDASADLPPEQTAALEALRLPIEKELGQPVTFKTVRFKISNGWAFVEGQTVKPDGAAIDYAQTPYKEAVAAGAFDDGFAALLHLENGSWKVATYEIGSTDVPWVEWPQTYGAPAVIFPAM
jgi:hypothetical protein